MPFPKRKDHWGRRCRFQALSDAWCVPKTWRPTCLKIGTCLWKTLVCTLIKRCCGLSKLQFVYSGGSCWNYFQIPKFCRDHLHATYKYDQICINHHSLKSPLHPLSSHSYLCSCILQSYFHKGLYFFGMLFYLQERKKNNTLYMM